MRRYIDEERKLCVDTLESRRDYDANTSEENELLAPKCRRKGKILITDNRKERKRKKRRREREGGKGGEIAHFTKRKKCGPKTCFGHNNSVST